MDHGETESLSPGDWIQDLESYWLSFLLKVDHESDYFYFYNLDFSKAVVWTGEELVMALYIGRIEKLPWKPQIGSTLFDMPEIHPGSEN